MDFIKTLAIESVGPDGQNGPFSRLNDPGSRSTPHFVDFRVWSQLSLMVKTVHFHSQTIPGVGKPPILPIFLFYRSPSLLVIRNSKVILAKNFHECPIRP
ncbi:hypothetical protein H5410_052999 [Solanum commersonii]|uniref:Uncharacterized protein n=1 Tax=Solanum commersonii TaxID=4109 RepID=A0A9J5X508_SOLCO|nr:hypothetical protein H5410_052999 [Solanum commersonii]